MIADINKLWVLEYSFNHNEYFSQPLLECVKSNMENFNKGFQTDYNVIGIFNTKNDVELFFEKHEDLLNGRSLFEDLNGNLRISPTRNA